MKTVSASKTVKKIYSIGQMVQTTINSKGEIVSYNPEKNTY